MKNLLYILPFIFVGCAKKTPPKANVLPPLMESLHESIAAVKQNLETHELQIIYTEISRDEEKVSFIDHKFQVDKNKYFYPASSVKLPVAVLALEFLENHPSIGAATPYVSSRDSLQHTIADDIKKIFAVSDNEAYNRLYELLGRDYINKKLKEKGLNARISHRLATKNPAEAKRNGLHFLVGKDTVTLGDGLDGAIESLKVSNIEKGKGFMRDSILVNEPMDFSEKNYFPVETQHELMKRIFFPNQYKSDERFGLSEVNQALLAKEMHIVPRLNGYQEWEVWDSFGKLFMFGDSKGRLPSNIKYYNKLGYAYGTLIDTAYIVDTQNDIEFMITATILVNDNQILNDDIYEYGEIGIPFMGQLGREIYQLELKKVRDIKSSD